MLLVVFVVFLGLFAGLALWISSVAGGGKDAVRARTRLEQAIRLPGFLRPDEVVDIRKDSTLSTVPWLNNLLASIRSLTQLTLVLQQADVRWNPGRFVLNSIAGWVLGSYLIYLRTGLRLPAMIVGLLAGGLPLLYVLYKRKRRLAKFLQAFPDALDLMVSALRGGHSMISALGIVASESPEPISRELKICFEEQNFGLDLRDALYNLIKRVPLQDLRLVATAMMIQKESGGNLAEVLDKTAYVIRERFRIQQQIMVYTAQGRMSGWILSLLPVGLGILMYLMNPEYMNLLLIRPLGQKMIWIAIGLNVLGILVIQKIVKIRV